MPDLIYFIASVNRSGSSWLCALLRSAGTVGEPRELLRAPREQFAQRLREDVCCVKLQLPLMRRIWMSLDDRHKKAARFVFLRREDTLRQAISLYRARRSGIWHLRTDRDLRTDRGRRRKHAAVRFDRRAILAKQRQVEARYERWESFFSREGLSPLRITYERLCEAPCEAVTEITTFLGRPYEGDLDDYTEIMRDDRTERWVERLTSGAAGR